jgi:hypothetical protein
MLERQIRGTKNETASNSIKFDKRYGRRQLIPGQD